MLLFVEIVFLFIMNYLSKLFCACSLNFILVWNFFFMVVVYNNFYPVSVVLLNFFWKKPGNIFVNRKQVASFFLCSNLEYANS